MTAWPQVPLGEVFEIARGGSPRPIDDYITEREDGINWISISDASDSSKFIERTKRRIRPEGVSRSRMVQPGDFLLTNSMSFGRPYIMRTSGCIHDGWLSLGKKRDGIDQNFFFHLLGSDAVYSEFARLAAGVTVKNLNIELVKGVAVPVPPLPEQRRIAEVLDRAETLRAQRRQALAQLDALAESIFESLFGNNPGSVKTVGELLTSGALLVHKDGNHGSLYPRADDFMEEGIPFLSARAIRDDGRIDDQLVEHLHPDKAAKLRLGWIIEGDVLLSHNASIGKVAHYDGRFERALIGTSLTAFRPNPQVLISAYLTAALRSSRFQRALEKNMGQTTRNQVPITAQRALQLSLPPLGVQREFASQMEAVERAKELQHASLASFDALFASLQHRAFRGEL